MNTFVINSIDPLTGVISVIFTIDGQDYAQSFTGLLLDDTLNSVLGQKLIDLQNNLDFQSSIVGQSYSVEINPDNSLAVSNVNEIMSPPIISRKPLQ